VDFSRIVHGEQAFDAHRPVVAGDVLSMVTTITGIRDAGKNELLVTETAITDQDGKPVATLTATLVSRGTAAQEAAS
jgi:acyl dehydratase